MEKQVKEYHIIEFDHYGADRELRIMQSLSLPHGDNFTRYYHDEIMDYLETMLAEDVDYVDLLIEVRVDYKTGDQTFKESHYFRGATLVDAMVYDDLLLKPIR